MIIRTLASNYDGVGDKIAEDIALGEVILTVDTAPSYTYTEVGDIPDGFMQSVHNGRYGEYMDMDTIDEISAMHEVVGDDKYNEAQTLNELQLMCDIEELQDTVDELLIESVGA